jgi:hypothetical protein
VFYRQRKQTKLTSSAWFAYCFLPNGRHCSTGSLDAAQPRWQGVNILLQVALKCLVGCRKYVSWKILKFFLIFNVNHAFVGWCMVFILVNLKFKFIMMTTGVTIWFSWNMLLGCISCLNYISWCINNIFGSFNFTHVYVDILGGSFVLYTCKGCFSQEWSSTSL